MIDNKQSLVKSFVRTNGLFKCLFLLAQYHAKRLWRELDHIKFHFQTNSLKVPIYVIYNPKERTLLIRESMIKKILSQKVCQETLEGYL